MTPERRRYLLRRVLGRPEPVPEPPSYHGLHITTPHIERTSIFNLPYNVMVMCERTSGWTVWDTSHGMERANQLGGEYDSKWLILDVDGHVIVNSRDRKDEA